MTYYTWTISKPGRQDINEVTTLPERHDEVHILELPGVAMSMHVDQTIPGHGRYTHDGGSMDELPLTWTKVDAGAVVVD